MGCREITQTSDMWISLNHGGYWWVKRVNKIEACYFAYLYWYTDPSWDFCQHPSTVKWIVILCCSKNQKLSTWKIQRLCVFQETMCSLVWIIHWCHSETLSFQLNDFLLLKKSLSVLSKISVFFSYNSHTNKWHLTHTAVGFISLEINQFYTVTSCSLGGSVCCWISRQQEAFKTD